MHSRAYSQRRPKHNLTLSSFEQTTECWSANFGGIYALGKAGYETGQQETPNDFSGRR